eukprot:TRINITY_DN13185_c0_g1_i2.p1 TRINITY_DN13185_c0_g1~~TRINITY_DN13185_c0_g1_i2.p1  ORF type:complete len:550 (+),score=96.68 TRINITY_DN13185_c0_g1_i2:80-1729(+)
MPIFRSPYADFEVDTKSSLTQFAFRDVPGRGAASAFVDGITGQSISFAELWRVVQSTARGLQEQGLKRGEIVAVWMPNCIEYVVAFHATIAAGGIVTTLNPAYVPAEVAHQLDNAGAVYIVTKPAFLEKVAEAQQTYKGLRSVFVASDTAEGTAIPFSSLDIGGEPKHVPIDPVNDVCVLPYSSGTTGLPKGTMLTHTNIISNLQQINQPGVMGESSALTPEDTLLAVLPFYHIYGMVVVMNSAIIRGARVVTMPSFDPELYLKNMETYNVTVAHIAPPLAQFLAKSPSVKATKMPKLKEFFCGAAPLGPELTAELSARFTGVVVRQGYGMTELSPVSHADRLKEPKIGSVGYLMPNMEAKIVDPETGKEMPLGTEASRGELLLRGPNVMKGYHRNDEATKGSIDDDGFLHTGDICYADPEGCYYIVDRLKELIKAKGFQVAPAELEALLMKHPEVADAAVIGAPAEKYGGREADGEVPKAFVVLQPSALITAQCLAEWMAPQVSPHKRLTAATIDFVPSVPKSASGKILRKDLRIIEAERPVTLPSKL